MDGSKLPLNCPLDAQAAFGIADLRVTNTGEQSRERRDDPGRCAFPGYALFQNAPCFGRLPHQDCGRRRLYSSTFVLRPALEVVTINAQRSGITARADKQPRQLPARLAMIRVQCDGLLESGQRRIKVTKNEL